MQKVKVYKGEMFMKGTWQHQKQQARFEPSVRRDDRLERRPR